VKVRRLDPKAQQQNAICERLIWLALPQQAASDTRARRTGDEEEA
jgi:hypothetical protein